jgi:6-phosphogluconolactonase
MTPAQPGRSRQRGLDPIDLTSNLPTPPKLPGKVVVASDRDELLDKLAADLIVHSLNCVRQFGDFHLALSGGKTPQPLFERLMYDPDCRAIAWRRTHLWMVDERCVPFDDPASNYRMIHETIVEHADIPIEQVHPIEAMSDSADFDYERLIKETLAWRIKGEDRLDYVLLGMGTDGHTASLFPHTDVLEERERFVRFMVAPHVKPSKRVTMTYPLINSSRFIAVLVIGASKAEAIRRVVEGDEPLNELPIKGVQPVSGELRWYLDAEACGGT